MRRTWLSCAVLFGFALVFGCLPVVAQAERVAAGAASDSVPTPTAALTVSANPTIGQPVTFNGSGSTCDATPCTYKWNDDGGEPPIGYWPLGTGQIIQYTFKGNAFTAYIRLTVTDADNRTATVEHNVSVAAPPPPAPVNSARPAVSGSAVVGDVLTASPGTWSNSPTYGYQWSDCGSSGGSCVSIGGATGSAYTVRSSDVGDTIEVTVTASNAGGSASASSAPTAVVPPAAPVNSGSGG